jgi:hypothetical protein
MKDINDILMGEIARLEVRLPCQLSGRVSNFRVLVRDDGLILAGQACTYYAKQVCSTCGHGGVGVSDTGERN